MRDDFYPIGSRSVHLYNHQAIMEKYGFTDEDDLFYEVSGPWGVARRFDIYQFKRPEIPANIPENCRSGIFPECLQGFQGA